MRQNSLVMEFFYTLSRGVGFYANGGQYDITNYFSQKNTDLEKT
jgi:hypothetical protein